MSNRDERQNTFCGVCGHYTSGIDPCPYCGTRTRQSYIPGFMDIEDSASARIGTRSAICAGFLQVFLGAFGAGRFYLGYKKMGFLQIAATVFSMGIAGFVWGLVDGILILSGRERYDATGKLLK